MPNNAPARDAAQLYRDHAAQVGRWATRLAGSASDADDIVQEVFLTVHRHLPLEEALRSPPAWLMQITRNVVRHLWRSRGRAARRAVECDLAAAASPAPDPFEQVALRRAAEQLETAMQSLDDRYREVYRLCEIEGLPSADVVALTGLKPETLRVRRFRARRQIAAQLGI